MSGRHAWEFFVPPSQFGDPARTAVRADGTRVWFADGTEALCGTSGLWNVNLGYNHRRIAEAVADALIETSYLSLFRYGHEWAERAAAALVDVSGADHFGRVIFSTSGSAANDVVTKLARHYWLLAGQSKRRVIVGLRGSYHGLTYGSFALTGEDLGQRAYGVDQRFVRHVSHEDPNELRALFAREGSRIAAVVVEPVLGSGALPLSDAVVAELAQLRREHGFLLVSDEVATGFGRTGPFFASQQWPVRPDVLVTSKGLTNGTCAASAVVVARDVCAAFDVANEIFVHGETQAGTPPTCAAILATIEAMLGDDALDRGRQVSEWLDGAFSDLVANAEVAAFSTGRGCFRALHLRHRDGALFDAADVANTVAAIRRAGAIVHPGPSCVQLVPALLYARDDFGVLIECVAKGLFEITALTDAA